MMNRSRTLWVTMVCVHVGLFAGSGACSGQVAAGPASTAAQARHPFYAFCFDIHDAQQRDLEQQAAMLKQLGYDGAGHVGLEALTERLESLDRADLRLFVAGITVNLTQPPNEPLAQLKHALPLLRNRQAVLYVVLTGYPPGDARGEEPAVTTLRTMADLAAQADVRLGLYPHTSDWVAQFAHAVSVANQVDRPNCGVIFNLCHFLRNEEADTLPAVLRAAQPRLVGVTLNGADLAGKNDADWGRLIQPLYRGSFDMRGLLRELKQINYRGPIGLMCYGITGDATDHLARSIAHWHELRAELE